jgi:hypothetical protein
LKRFGASFKFKVQGSRFKVSVGSILRRGRGFDDDAGLRPNKCSNEVNPGEVAQTVREIAGRKRQSKVCFSPNSAIHVSEERTWSLTVQLKSFSLGMLLHRTNGFTPSGEPA